MFKIANLSDKELILQLMEQNVSQAQQIKMLESKLLLLLEQVQKQSIKKDSHNSSLPPSSDLFSTNKSLRPVSVLKKGGQKGHKGSTLEMTLTPDKIIDLKSTFCSKCGEHLPLDAYILKAKRQVVEIPPIKPIYEEYRQFSSQCTNCLHQQIADFPTGINAPIQYGNSVEALVSYLSVYQYVPYARLQKMFAQTFSLPLSQGSINNILERVAQKCAGIYQYIKQQVAQSTVVGSDETGTKVKGEKWWIWTWQTFLCTFIIASDNRGSDTVDSIWKNGLPNAILISDRWAAQLKMIAKNHQLCLAHLLRDLIFLEESEKQLFATQFKELILDIFNLKNKQKELKKAYSADTIDALLLEKRLNELLVMGIDEQNTKTITFQGSMLKNRNYILPCIYNLDIPADNNGSERAIRNIKVKQKISGQFKTGQNTFCIIRSVIETLLKRKVEVFPSLIQIIRLKPE